MVSSLLAPTVLEEITHVRESIKSIDIHYLNCVKQHFQHIDKKKKVNHVRCSLSYCKNITSVLFHLHKPRDLTCLTNASLAIGLVNGSTTISLVGMCFKTTSFFLIISLTT